MISSWKLPPGERNTLEASLPVASAMALLAICTSSICFSGLWRVISTPLPPPVAAWS